MTTKYKQKIFWLTPKLIEYLEFDAFTRKVSQSDIIRQLLKVRYAKQPKKELEPLPDITDLF